MSYVIVERRDCFFIKNARTDQYVVHRNTNKRWRFGTYGAAANMRDELNDQNRKAHLEARSRSAFSAAKQHLKYGNIPSARMMMKFGYSARAEALELLA